MSDSDDDAPLFQRASSKGVASAPAVKKEQGAAAKPGVVKAEVKEEDAPGVKGPQGKGQQADAKAKGQDKKPPATKGKDDAAQNGKAAAETKKVVKEEGKQPKEKKEYDMPGQTRDPPPETDSLRKFYTSLLEQRPESDMAKKWCLTHGLLSRDMAEELMAQMKKSKPAAIKSPAKPSGRSEVRSAAAKTRRPADKAPAAKRQRQAVSPPKKTRAKYSDEEDEASSSAEEEEEDDDDDDEPIGRAKPAAKGAAAAKAPAASKGPAAAAAPKGKPVKGKDKAFTDGGLDDSDDDDLPLVQRGRR